VVDVVRRGLSGEGELLLRPLAARVERLTAAGRAGDAAFAAEQLRALSGAVRRQAVLDGLRSAGRIVLDVGGHLVELDSGRLVSVDRGPVPGAAEPGVAGRAEADEVLAVGRWLRREARAGAVRVVGPVDARQAATLASVLEGAENREHPLA
jgi:hypothetical protein